MLDLVLFIVLFRVSLRGPGLGVWYQELVTVYEIDVFLDGWNPTIALFITEHIAIVSCKESTHNG